MGMIQDKRRFPRKILEKPAEIFDCDTGLSMGVLEDVSRGGFSVLTNQDIRPSETRNVTLVLPGPKESTHRVSLMAECVWCQSLSEQTDFAAGFYLKEIKDQDNVALNYFIRDYQVVTG